MIHVSLFANTDQLIHVIRHILAEAKVISLIGVVNDLAGFRLLAKEKSPDVIIIDPRAMRSQEPAQVSETIKEVKLLSDKIGFILLTDWCNRSRFEIARHLGFKGFCLKTISRDELIEAIKVVAQGEVYIHSDYCKQAQEQSNNTLFDSLISPRQQEILNLLMVGYTNREIADILYLSPETVKSHISIILKTLRVRDRTQAVSLVLWELIDNVPI